MPNQKITIRYERARAFGRGTAGVNIAVTQKGSNFVQFTGYRKKKYGFALVAVLTIMALLTLLCLALLSLSSVSLRSRSQSEAQEVARANARLALMIALGDLQKYTGSDQRVTANASVIGGPDIENPHWVGAWKTTATLGDQEWPLVGKNVGNTGGPYLFDEIYSDLRSSSQSNWREDQRIGWLVSKANPSTDFNTDLTNSPLGIEMVGPGTLGNNYNPETSVWVEKVEITPPSNHTGGQNRNGAYAYYVSDDSQKVAALAAIQPPTNDEVPFLAAQAPNLGLIEDVDDNHPFQDLDLSQPARSEKAISTASLAFLGSNPSNLQQALGENFHDLTRQAPGLFTDTANSGLKADLASMLFGRASTSGNTVTGDELLTFPAPAGSSELPIMASDYPIIPGNRHAVMGPRFAALRSWGIQKYLSGLADAVPNIRPEQVHTRSNYLYRHADDWLSFANPGRPNLNKSDGFIFDSSQWAARAPKIQPVMTDVRWHYYFSNTEGGQEGLRFHIIPRVCLWNPYDVAMSTEELMVFMPNPFIAYYSRWGPGSVMTFLIEPGVGTQSVQNLKTRYADNPDSAITQWQPGSISGITPFGLYYFRVSFHNESPLFPRNHQLGFTLEPTTIGPGECLVFSPNADSGISAAGVTIQPYDENNVGNNRLSANADPWPSNHFYHDISPDDLQVVPSGTSKAMTPAELRDLDLGVIYDYIFEGGPSDNYAFFLKAGSAGTDLSVLDALSSDDHPTLQFVTAGNHLTNPSPSSQAFINNWMPGSRIGSGGTFGFIENFLDNPGKTPPRTHQFGAKMLWLNEDFGEAEYTGSIYYPSVFRSGFVSPWGSNVIGTPSNHLAFNTPILANWNVRAHLVTKSPNSAPRLSWAAQNSAGNWNIQFHPPELSAPLDRPQINAAGQFAKFPFGAAASFSGTSAIMFSLPDTDAGALSLGSLRHAQITPYSYYPSYIIGNSMHDQMAPFDATAPAIAEQAPWYQLIDATFDGGVAASQIMQTRTNVVTPTIGGRNFSSDSEIFGYDMAYEVNQNLWDRFFISGISLGGSSNDRFAIQTDQAWSLNQRYQFNPDAMLSKAEAEDSLQGADGLEFGYWHNAYLMHNVGAFNVNSTSVEAWAALLGSLQGDSRPGQGSSVPNDQTPFSRVMRPKAFSSEADSSASSGNAWRGGRVLTETELRLLAENIVAEVKTRGPFLSLADFINRRLGPESDPSSHLGTIDRAIELSNLNSSMVNDSRFVTPTNNAGQSNHPDYPLDATRLAETKAAHAPSYLMQGDVLETIAPTLTARGDSFTIRTYGESRDANGNILAKAYLEATVRRSPEYIEAKPPTILPQAGSGNYAVDRAMIFDPLTNEKKNGNLNALNSRFGRRYQILGFRWLSQNEI